jgi:hypothetical protein
VLVPLVACVPSVSDRIVVTNGGFFSSSVTVVSGKESGCRGIVSNDYLGKDGAVTPPTTDTNTKPRARDARGDVYAPAKSGERP